MSYPKGAVRSLDELRAPTKVYGVSKGFGLNSINAGKPLKHISDLWLVLWNIPTIGDRYPHDFLFTNYWDAHAYHLRLKAKFSRRQK